MSVTAVFGGTLPVEGFHRPQDTSALERSRECSGSRCLIMDGWLSLDGWKPGLEPGYYLHASLNFETALRPPAEKLLADCEIGDTVSVPITSGGEIIGVGGAYWDSPPIFFLPNGLVRAITDGISTSCTDVTGSGSGLSCPADWTARDMEPVESTWTDSWTTSGVVSGSVNCSSDAAGKIGTCAVAAGTTGNNIRVTLERVVPQFEWKQPQSWGGAPMEPAKLVSTVPLTCHGSKAPNLQIEALTIKRTPVPQHTDYSAIDVDHTVTNNGNAVAPASVTSLRFDNGADGTWEIGPFTTPTATLPAAGSVPLAWPNVWQAYAGPHRVEVCADATNVVDESNEMDNCRILSFTVQNPPLACAPQSPVATTDSPILFTAKGGALRNPFYRWTAAGAAPDAGVGRSFTTSYSTAGVKTVSLIEYFVDVNGDGKATTADLNDISSNFGKARSGGGGSWQNQLNRYDVNADGSVNGLDAQLVTDFANTYGPQPLPAASCTITVEARPTITPSPVIVTPSPVAPTATPLPATPTPTPQLTPSPTGGPFFPGPIRETE